MLLQLTPFNDFYSCTCELNLRQLKLAFGIISLVKKSLIILSAGSFFGGAILITGLIQPLIFPVLGKLIGHYPGVRVDGLLDLFGLLLIFCAIFIQVVFWLQPSHRVTLQIAYDKITLKIRSWSENKFGRWIDFHKPPQKPIRVNYVDVIIILSILLFAIIFTLAQLQSNYPFAKLDSDAANLSSFVAAQDNPNNFKGDFTLGDQSNFGYYYAILMPLLHWLLPIAGNYAMAMMIVLGPTVFIYLMGLYFLGRVVFQNRFWSIFFCVISAIPLIVGNEIVGLPNDPLPRFMFQAFIPYVLIMVWAWREKPEKWIIPTILIGLLVYVHSVSAPSYAAGIFLGFVILLPKEWSNKRKIGFIFFLLLILALLIMPFAIHYIQNRRLVSSGNYDLINWLFIRVYPQELLFPGIALTTLLRRMIQFGLLPLAIIGLFFNWLLEKNRKTLVLILSWSIGILCISILLPYIERNIENIFHISPIETEFVRGIKNLVLIFILLAVWLLSSLFQNIKFASFRIIPILLGVILFALIFNARAYYTVDFVPLINCFKSGKLICGQVTDLDKVIIAIRDKTPVGSRIFFSRNFNDTEPLAVRYIALHPLVYSWKDLGIFESAPSLLDDWFSVYQTIREKVNTTGWYQRYPDEFLRFVRNLGAQYVVLEKPNWPGVLKIPPSSIVFQNNNFILFQIDD